MTHATGTYERESDADTWRTRSVVHASPATDTTMDGDSQFPMVPMQAAMEVAQFDVAVMNLRVMSS